MVVVVLVLVVVLVVLVVVVVVVDVVVAAVPTTGRGARVSKEVLIEAGLLVPHVRSTGDVAGPVRLQLQLVAGSEVLVGTGLGDAAGGSMTVLEGAKVLAGGKVSARVVVVELSVPNWQGVEVDVTVVGKVVVSVKLAKLSGEGLLKIGSTAA